MATEGSTPEEKYGEFGLSQLLWSFAYRSGADADTDLVAE